MHEGRAVQDIWIMPRFSERSANLNKTNNMYGTTLRAWDSSIQAWRVTWIDPLSGERDELIGRRSGEDIVQIGTHSSGIPIRWCFTDITSDSFHWIGEVLQHDGNRWKLAGGLRARRTRCVLAAIRKH